MFLALSGKSWQLLQLCQSNGGSDVSQAVIEAYKIMVIFFFGAMTYDFTKLGSDNRIICRHHAPFSGGHIFSGIKRKTSRAKRAYFFPLKFCAMRLAGVFNDEQIMSLGYFYNLVHLTTLPEEMHREDSLSFGSDGSLNKMGINVKCLFIDINKHRISTTHTDGIGSGNKGERCGDDLIPWANLLGEQRGMQ